jgi:hypothetical protein
MLRVISCRRRLLGAEAKKATICRVAPSQPPSHVGAETRNIVSFSFEGLCDVGFLACRQGRHSFLQAPGVIFCWRGELALLMLMFTYVAMPGQVLVI